jgi:hypothetical protein
MFFLHRGMFFQRMGLPACKSSVELSQSSTEPGQNNLPLNTKKI